MLIHGELAWSLRLSVAPAPSHVHRDSAAYRRRQHVDRAAGPVHLGEGACLCSKANRHQAREWLVLPAVHSPRHTRRRCRSVGLSLWYGQRLQGSIPARSGPRDTATGSETGSSEYLGAQHSSLPADMPDEQQQQQAGHGGGQMQLEQQRPVGRQHKPCQKLQKKQKRDPESFWVDDPDPPELGNSGGSAGSTRQRQVPANLPQVNTFGSRTSPEGLSRKHRWLKACLLTPDGGAALLVVLLRTASSAALRVLGSVTSSILHDGHPYAVVFQTVADRSSGHISLHVRLAPLPAAQGQAAMETRPEGGQAVGDQAPHSTLDQTEVAASKLLVGRQQPMAKSGLELWVPEPHATLLVGHATPPERLARALYHELDKAWPDPSSEAGHARGIRRGVVALETSGGDAAAATLMALVLARNSLLRYRRGRDIAASVELRRAPSQSQNGKRLRLLRVTVMPCNPGQPKELLL